MDATEVTEVCRLCPSSGGGQNLLNVFDQKISFKYNIRDVIAINTGIEILEKDLVSKKICQRCCTILYRMFEFRLDALKQDRKLREKCRQFLEDKGIRLPNTCITIKKEKCNSNSTSKTLETESDIVKPSITTKEEFKRRLHPSVIDVYRNYPNLVLPTKCFDRHIAPVVSFTMGEVETYFRNRKLDMRKFIYKPRLKKPQPLQEEVKEASFSPKQKTVAPLKISKKLLENNEDSSSDSSYICTTVPKGRRGRKRKILSTDSERSVESKFFRSNQDDSPPLVNSIVDTPESIVSDPKVIETPVSNSSCDSKISIPVRIPSPQSDNSISDDHATALSLPPTPTPSPIPLPTPADPILKDSRTPSPAPSTSSMISTSSGSKSELIESIGLIPTITTTKTHTLLVCNLCGSVHHNAFELKRHTRKHMVCQFCKHRFKSIEAKQNHVDNFCQIKNIMNSSGPTVALEKIHLNLDVRKKYKDAFANFELIPGLVELAPVEHVIIKAASPPPPVDADNVIVLSDEDDEINSQGTDPLSDIPTPSVIVPPPIIENVVYNTVSIVKPDIRIKYSTLLNGLQENLTDKELAKELIALFKPEKAATIEKMVQTDLPASKDIKVNNSEGTCELKHLKTQLLTYKVPVTISTGQFHVAYQFKNKKTKKGMALWNDLPVIDISKEDDAKTGLESKDTFSPEPKCSHSQIDSLNGAVSSVPAMTNITTNPVASNSITSTVSSNSGLATLQNTALNQPVGKNNRETPRLNNANVNLNNTSNSATPLLQNYALSITAPPVIHSPMLIPRTYINSALNKNTTTSNKIISAPVSNNLPSRPLLKNCVTVNKPKNVPVINSPDSGLLCVSSSVIQPPIGSSLITIPSSTMISPVQPTYSLINIPSSTTIFPVQSTYTVPNIPTPKTIDPAQLTCSLTNIPSSSTTILPAQSTNSLINIPSSLATIIPTQSIYSLTNIPPLATITPTQSVHSSTNIPTSTVSDVSISTSEKNTISSTPQVPETSKFRVKNIWELQ